MNIEDEYKRIMEKHKSNNNRTKGSKKIFNKILTKILLSVILVLTCLIFANFNTENKELVTKYLFEDNLAFTTISNLYQKYFGEVVPTNNDLTAVVSSNTFSFSSIESYNDGYKMYVTNNSVVQTFNSGIIVFIGEKEDYGNVIIVQGIDGVDIWYGNIANVSVSLYDYIEKNAILGEANGEFIYTVFSQDGTYLSYDEYLQDLED